MCSYCLRTVRHLCYHPKVHCQRKGVTKNGEGESKAGSPGNTLGDGYPHTRYVQPLMTLPIHTLRPDSTQYISGTTPHIQSRLHIQGSPPTHRHRTNQEVTPLMQMDPSPSYVIPIIKPHGLHSTHTSFSGLVTSHASHLLLEQGLTWHPTCVADAQTHNRSSVTSSIAISIAPVLTHSSVQK